MIRHIVFWSLKPEAEGRTAAENGVCLRETALALQGKIPGLLGMEVSLSILDSSEPVQAALLSTHESVEALRTYMEHPLHLPIIEWMGKVAASRYVVNYEI